MVSKFKTLEDEGIAILFKPQEGNCLQYSVATLEAISTSAFSQSKLQFQRCLQGVWVVKQIKMVRINCSKTHTHTPFVICIWMHIKMERVCLFPLIDFFLLLLRKTLLNMFEILMVESDLNRIYLIITRILTYTLIAMVGEICFYNFLSCVPK